MVSCQATKVLGCRYLLELSNHFRPSTTLFYFSSQTFDLNLFLTKSNNRAMKQSLSSGNLAYRIFPSIQSTHGFVCFECRRRASKLAFRASALTSIPLSSRRYASSEPDPDPDSFSERLRRKIWKQDESLDETNLGVGKNASQSSTPKKAHLKDYIPATTWEGLEQVGGPTGWWEEAWDRDHYFEGSVPRDGHLEFWLIINLADS